MKESENASRKLRRAVIYSTQRRRKDQMLKALDGNRATPGLRFKDGTLNLIFTAALKQYAIDCRIRLNVSAIRVLIISL
jgi:hypothetical protein